MGIFSAIAVYPVLHELGHAAVACIFGAKVCKITFFPQPSVLCNTANVSNGKCALIGLGGLIFPAAVTVLKTPKNFCLWYVKLNLTVICFISFVIAEAELVLFVVNRKSLNSDITKILEYTPESIFKYAFLFAVLGAFCFYGAVRMKPLKRCSEFI